MTAAACRPLPVLSVLRAVPARSKAGGDEPGQVTEDDIASLVDAFYAKVRQDPHLGPIFARALGDEGWDSHLATLRDFWSSVMLTSGRYKGAPLAVHMRLDGLTPSLFDRWLTLFGQTCDELFEPRRAGAFRAKAARIAQSLLLGLSRQSGAVR
jgi:hemoglobin